MILFFGFCLTFVKTVENSFYFRIYFIHIFKFKFLVWLSLVVVISLLQPWPIHNRPFHLFYLLEDWLFFLPQVLFSPFIIFVVQLQTLISGWLQWWVHWSLLLLLHLAIFSLIFFGIGTFEAKIVNFFPCGRIILFTEFFNPNTGAFALDVLIGFVAGRWIGVYFERVVLHEIYEKI